MFEFLFNRQKHELSRVQGELTQLRNQLAPFERVLSTWHGDGGFHHAFAHDGLINSVAGLGDSRDKRSYNDWGTVIQLDRERASAMVRSNWLAANIVKVRAEDMTRAWVDVQWDGKKDDMSRQQAIDDADTYFGFRKRFRDGLDWARMYGGSAGILMLNGNDDLEEPIDIDTLPQGCLRGVEWFDRWLLGPQDLQQSFMDYGPEFFTPRFYSIGSIDAPARVHRSRMIFIDGVRLDKMKWLANGMWHDSVLQVCMEAIKDYAATMAGLATMFFESNVDVMMVKGLANLLSQPQGEAKIYKRFSVAQTVKSMNRMLMMDADDRYEKKGNNFTGLAGIVDKFETAICAAARSTRTKLLGESAGGLNATGQGEEQDNDKVVAAEQETVCREPITKWYKVVCHHLFGSVPAGFKLMFNPLRVESKLERAQRELVQAQARTTYVQAGCLPAQVVTRELKEEDFLTTLEDDDVSMVAENEAANAEQEAQIAKLQAQLSARPKPGNAP